VVTQVTSAVKIFCNIPCFEGAGGYSFVMHNVQTKIRFVVAVLCFVAANPVTFCGHPSDLYLSPNRLNGELAIETLRPRVWVRRRPITRGYIFATICHVTQIRHAVKKIGYVDKYFYDCLSLSFFCRNLRFVAVKGGRSSDFLWSLT
jgi:hypothetical protein